ncbi:MAG: hypothetical protein JSU07_04905 [Bacteroidetes bacterium]|nr:hypothetical protein [Bacteroidota bacterium]
MQAGFTHKIKYYYAFALVFVCLVFISQTRISVAPNYIEQKTEQNNLTTQFISTYPDSSVNYLHQYTPINYLGNLGYASPDYFLRYGTNNAGFNYINKTTNNDLFTDKDISYYKLKGPYAKLEGITGSKELQMFKMIFTTSFKNGLNLGLKFNRYSSLGFYSRQLSLTNNLVVTSNYQSKKDNGFYAYFLLNSNRNQENGGVKNDTLTLNEVMTSKDLVLTKLSYANRDNREYKFMINPYFKIAGDSVSNTKHYLQLKTNASLQTYKYKDALFQGSGLYNNSYYDTTQTYDSTAVKQIENRVDYTLINTNKNYRASIGYKTQLNAVWQHKDSTFFNHLIVGDFSFGKKHVPDSLNHAFIKNYQSTFNLAYVAFGANQNNFKIENTSIFTFKNNSALSINFLLQNKQVDYFNRQYLSNNFYWQNLNFTNQQLFHGKINYLLSKHISFEGQFQNIFGFCYFDSSGLSRQASGAVQAAMFGLSARRVFFKHLGLYFTGKYQLANTHLLWRLPPAYGLASLYYTGNLFRNNLQLQTGVQVYTYSSFTPYAYMPATQQFILQNSLNTSPYLYTDVFLNARIRPVTVFLKIENLLQTIAPQQNYWLVKGYYQPDFAIRFGISWSFFD